MLWILIHIQKMPAYLRSRETGAVSEDQDQQRLKGNEQIIIDRIKMVEQGKVRHLPDRDGIPSSHNPHLNISCFSTGCPNAKSAAAV